MHYCAEGRGDVVRLTIDPSRPIYQQIIDEFKRAVARGEMHPGDRIPAQRELAQMIKVNPNTVQRAYREMEQMGLVETMRGQGTFIRQDGLHLDTIREELALEATNQFVEQMKGLGYTPQRILTFLSEHLHKLGGSKE